MGMAQKQKRRMKWSLFIVFFTLWNNRGIRAERPRSLNVYIACYAFFRVHVVFFVFNQIWPYTYRVNGLDIVLQEERKVCIRAARRFLRDKSLAEDVAQDALMAMVVRSDKFVSEAHRMAWLHVVARNRAISENRRRHADALGLQPGEEGRSSRERLGVGHHAGVAPFALWAKSARKGRETRNGGPPPASEQARPQPAGALGGPRPAERKRVARRSRAGSRARQCPEVRLDHLKYEQRQVIEMHYLRGMTAQEIAADLKLSVETVRTRLRRSLRLLRTGVPRG
jgi:RNA polymerase sigma factor (sigma-70 family)